MNDIRTAEDPNDGATDRFPFLRPSTLFNAVIERVLLLFPVRALALDDLEPMHARSRDALLALGCEPLAVDAVRACSDWVILPGRAPANAWGGEVLVRGDERPRVAMYEDCPLTRLPSRLAFRVASQLAVDHMYGHLYEYHRHAEDWGEEVACRWQVRLLLQRSGAGNRALAAVVALTHRFHKQIPLSNY